jgi:pyrroloquinoline quinone biosynthesis protein B
MSGFPHPTIVHTMERLFDLAVGQRGKVRFIHLNHTNPAWREGTAARKSIEAAGFRVAEEGEIVPLGE